MSIRTSWQQCRKWINNRSGITNGIQIKTKTETKYDIRMARKRLYSQIRG